MHLPKHDPRATPRHRRKLLIAGILIFALVAIALALGLGLGLTLGHNKASDGSQDDNQDAPSTFSQLPTSDSTSLWKPAVAENWQIVLLHPPVISPNDTSIKPDVGIFDIDLFDTPSETIERLHTMGKRVICYFSAGSYEDWRPDAKAFQPDDLGKNLDGWKGEKWLKLGSDNVRSIMKKRLQLAKDKGCDGVDPDNVDGYENDNGLGLTSQDSVDYVSYLSSVTVPLNLSLGLKNAGAIVEAVLPVVQFSVNEECVKYGDCIDFKPFIDAGKPVFHIEYPDTAGENLKDSERAQACSHTGDVDGSSRFSTVLKKMNLDEWVVYCDPTTST